MSLVYFYTHPTTRAHNKVSPTLTQISGTIRKFPCCRDTDTQTGIHEMLDSATDQKTDGGKGEKTKNNRVALPDFDLGPS